MTATVAAFGTREASGGADGLAALGRIRREFLCRVSGLPASTFAGLRATETSALLDELWAAEQIMAARRPDLVEALHAAVGREADRDRRRRLLFVARVEGRSSYHPSPGVAP